MRVHAMTSITFCLAALLSTAACSRAPRDPRHAHVPIERFAQVDAGLYRGAQPRAAGFRELKKLGVRTIINLRTEDEDSAHVPDGMTVLQMPAHITRPRETEIAAFFDVALDPELRPVFIHCSEGRERSGFYAALYRIEVDAWTPAKALDEMRALGFRDSDHPEVVEFVLSYRARGFVRTVADRLAAAKFSRDL